MTALFVKRQQGWLVNFKGASNNVDECFTLDSEFTNFIDDQDLALIPSVFDCRNCNLFKRFDVDAVAEDPEPLINALVSHNGFFFGDNINDFVAETFASLEDRHGLHAADDRGITEASSHLDFPLALVDKHFEDFFHHSGFPAAR